MPRGVLVEVRGAVIKGEKILLVRGKGEGRTWSLPGGEIDPESTCPEFLKEKILNDTGVHVDVIRAIHVRDELGGNFRSLKITYLCAPRSGKLMPRGTVKEARWIDIGRAVKLPLSDLTREIVLSLMERFLLVIRNRDVRRILIGTPKGHIHKRVVIELDNGIIVLQEATVENLVRAFVEVEMHPWRRAIMLEGGIIETRKEGYSKYQLLEADIDDSDVEGILSDMLGMGGEDQDLKGNS